MIKTRLINQVRQSKKYIALTVIAQWIKLCANIVMIYIMSDILSCFLYNKEFTARKTVTIIVSAVLISAVRYICNVCESKTSFLASAQVKKTLRSQMYQKLTRLGASYHEKVSTSEIIQVFVEGIDQLELYFGKYLPQFFFSMLAPLTLFIILSFVSWRAALVLFICVPLIPASIIAVQKIAKKLLSKYWGAYVDLGDTFLENIQGLTTLKVYQADERKNREMNEKAEQFRKITMKVLTMQLNSVSVMDIVAYGGSALGVIIAVCEAANGRIDLPQAFLIIMLSADFFLPLRLLGSFFHVAMNGMAASDKLFRLLDMDEPKKGETELNDEIREIKADSMSFSYDGKKQVLSDVSFNIKKGSLTAIVGESGCGKSTVASLLCGTVTGYSGSLTVNGIQLSDILEKSLLSHITAVNFNSYIFAGTVRENLCLAKPDAEDEVLIKVLRQVRLWNFLESQDGLDTQLAVQGSNFSGGQRQRLALARALLHDSDVYIFDEITSNIDSESENDIMQIIHSMAGDKTVILISHRLENVVKADCIYLFDGGKIAECGTHEKLMADSKKYSVMFRAQAELEAYSNQEVRV